jgi:uncharacterized membrane protein
MQFFLSLPFVKTAAVSVILFIILDLVWLAGIARALYFKHLGYLAELEAGRIVFNLPVGLLVQAIIGFGLAFFVTLGLRVQNDLATAIGVGAFSGFVLYCTYDLTNLSFIKGYPVAITIIDIAWGTAQGFFAGIYVYFLTQWFTS